MPDSPRVVSTGERRGCLLAIARAVASLVLGVLAFVGMLYFGVLGSLSSKLLEPDVYKGVLAETRFYERIHTAAVAQLHDDGAVELGGLEIAEPEDTSRLLQEIAPADYVRLETERAIDATVSYLRGDTVEFQGYFDLGPPLERLRPAVLEYLAHRIDSIPEERIEAGRCTARDLRSIVRAYEQSFRVLSDGRLPDSLPSTDALSAACRVQLFDAVYARLAAIPEWEEAVQSSSDSVRSELRREFEAADSNAVFKSVAGHLAGPRVDNAVTEIRAELAPGDRLNLIRLLTEDGRSSEAEVKSELAELRDTFGLVRGPGRTAALVLLIVATLVLALLYLPNPAGMARWPGITLLLGGLACLIISLAVRSAVPRMIGNSANRGFDELSEPAFLLATDVSTAFGEQLSPELIGPAVVFAAAGAALFLGSFVLARMVRG